MINFNEIKSLFNVYSPQKSDDDLRKLYTNITYLDSSNIVDIRMEYNNLISENLLNETVIKSNFIKHHALKKSPNRTITIFELNSANSRADISMINGSSEVFEIKTEYDSLIRLEGQINDYIKLYDYVSMIVPINKSDEVIEVIPDYIGIIGYYLNRLGNVSFKTIRKAELNLNINSKVQLEQLTKVELNKIVNLKKFNNSKELTIEYLLNNKTSEEINNIFKKTLKQKYKKQWKYLHSNYKNIYLLDYQWFFKNNVSSELVYR